VTRGHFAYESGDHGDTWLDLDVLFVRPAGLAPYVSRLASQLARHRVEAVCGPLVGGAFVAQAVAASLDLTFTWSTWPSYALPPSLVPSLRGRRVAIVDDAVNAGSAVQSTATALTAAGATIAVVGTLLALNDASARVGTTLGVPVEHLATLPTTLWPAAACPLCATGAPLARPPA
jgi:orotate phosphoribosyltransferase